MLLKAKIPLWGESPSTDYQKQACDELMHELQNAIVLPKYPWHHDTERSGDETKVADSQRELITLMRPADFELPQEYQHRLVDQAIPYVDKDGLVSIVIMHNAYFDKNDEDAGLIAATIKDEFDKMVSDFMLVCHIAKPTALETSGVLVSVDGREFRERQHLYQMDTEPLKSAAQAAAKPSLQPMRILPIREVWDWFVKIPDLDKQLGNNTIWRAVNFLRLAIGGPHSRPGDLIDYTRIVWIMMGLETLYPVSDIYEVSGYRMFNSRQISNQAFSFLRSLELISDSDKDIFDDQMRILYDLRNKFFHGQLSFPRPVGLLSIDINEFNASVKKLDPLSGRPSRKLRKEVDIQEIAHYGLSLLVATMQEMSQRGRYDTGFEPYTGYKPRPER